ncbi:MAG: hypothetical protein H7834_16120, partial [Magnetococcus sp. YQC-9]
MVGQWIKHKIVLAALVVFGLVAPLDSAQAASVSGTSYHKAIVVAVTTTADDATNNQVIQAAEVIKQNSNGLGTFQLSNLPVNQDITLYFFIDGSLYPMIFNSGNSDAFVFLSDANFNLGLVSIYALTGTSVNPTNGPKDGTITQASALPKRTTQSLTNVQNSALNPFTTMSASALLQYGDAVFQTSWYVVADQFYALALQKAADGSVEKTRAQVMHAITQTLALLNTARAVNGVTTRNYTDPNTTMASLGDILAGFGCDRRHLGLSGLNCAGMTKPNVLPADSPTGSNISDWLSSYVIPKIISSLSLLEQVPSTMSSFMTRDPGDLFDSGTTYDYGDVLVIKGVLEAGLAELYWLQAYDAGVDIDANQRLSVDTIKANNPTLGTLSAHAPTSLTNAKTHATNAVNHLLAAVTAIQGRTDTTTTN